MTKLVNNGPEEHLDLVEKMQKGLKVRRSGVYDIGGGVCKEGDSNDVDKKDCFDQSYGELYNDDVSECVDMQQINYNPHNIDIKVAQKNSSTLLKELAVLEAAKIKAEKPKFCVLHK